ncbi:MAG: transposase [Methyloversatilis sp.]|uniref:transposase n=1 Tax=Methyloversatilis sp. TaxID=2569862 RepID=UPI002735FBB4|nr:transposase [Methyloversatilis sp.]MDP3874798.1 transposase [Methyloversatilis sp.]
MNELAAGPTEAIVEPPNGWIKNILGLRQFSLRGVDTVRREFKLVCLVLNLRRMSYLVPT